MKLNPNRRLQEVEDAIRQAGRDIYEELAEGEIPFPERTPARKDYGKTKAKRKAAKKDRKKSRK